MREKEREMPGVSQPGSHQPETKEAVKVEYAEQNKGKKLQSKTDEEKRVKISSKS